VNREEIIQELTVERERLDQAIAALGGGRSSAVSSVASTPSRRGRRHMSAEGRKRISDAQKKRWAAQRKTTKTTASAFGTAQKTASRSGVSRRRGGISAAGRKRISEMMKRRWAERRGNKAA
jgi:hypothetical protein